MHGGIPQLRDWRALDRLYQRIRDDLDALFRDLGLKGALRLFLEAGADFVFKPRLLRRGPRRH